MAPKWLASGSSWAQKGSRGTSRDICFVDTGCVVFVKRSARV